MPEPAEVLTVECQDQDHYWGIRYDPGDEERVLSELQAMANDPEIELSIDTAHRMAMIVLGHARGEF